MPPPPDQPSPTDQWLQGRFAGFYARNPPPVPDRFGKREYAFLFFGRKMMWRHIAFRTRAEFERFHVERGPAHSYYSTAYYDRPDAPTMQEKGWKAAELIFDLDADHVPGSEKLPYPQQLERVKVHFIRLVDEFVRGDFGFDEKDLVLTFSGGRGYHCHVKAERALELTSQERREIVDYITGTGLEMDRFVRDSTVTSTAAGKFPRTKRRIVVSSAATPGWGGRINHAIQQYFGRLRSLPEDQLRAQLVEIPKIGAKEAEYIVRNLPLLTDEHISRGFVDRGPPFRKLIHYVVDEQVVPLAKGETDEPVTSDTKRVIRTPGTLHGKSGLKVVELSREELDPFDPLRDAVAFGDEPVSVDVTKPATVALKGESIKVEVGPMRLPEWAAVFAMMRGWATPKGP